jgi:hypothetical protein
MRRRRLDSDEAQALRDLSTTIKNSDPAREAARQSTISIDNRVGVINLAEALEARIPPRALSAALDLGAQEGTFHPP